jgi:hypothetical protein
MKTARALGLLFEIVLLAIGLTTGGPIDEQLRSIALLVAFIVGGLVIFAVVVLMLGIVAQRTPPFDIWEGSAMLEQFAGASTVLIVVLAYTILVQVLMSVTVLLAQYIVIQVKNLRAMLPKKPSVPSVPVIETYRVGGGLMKWDWALLVSASVEILNESLPDRD